MDIFGAIILTTTGSSRKDLSQRVIGSDLHFLKLTLSTLDNRL